MEVFPRGRKQACYVGKGKKGVNFPEEGELHWGE